MGEEKNNTPVHIDTGDVGLDDICLDLEHSDAELEEHQFVKLRNMFSGKKGRKNRISHQCQVV